MRRHGCGKLGPVCGPARPRPARGRGKGWKQRHARTAPTNAHARPHTRTPPRPRSFLVSEAGDAMIVSLPGTTRLGDWAANLSVHYEPVEAKYIADATALTGPERVSACGAYV